MSDVFADEVRQPNHKLAKSGMLLKKRANVVGVFVIPKRSIILSKGILKWRERVVGGFGNPKRRLSEVDLFVVRRMICFHN
ncbi:hypothetical protein C7G41_23050 [Bradyrhizobium sp. MOS002]|nr:hypothetical protein C7G41_23050 [Bradyrhizobium sp. MOS002]